MFGIDRIAAGSGDTTPPVNGPQHGMTDQGQPLFYAMTGGRQTGPQGETALRGIISVRSRFRQSPFAWGRWKGFPYARR